MKPPAIDWRGAPAAVYSLRLSPAQRRLLELGAELSGLRLSEFVAQRALDGANQLLQALVGHGLHREVLEAYRSPRAGVAEIERLEAAVLRVAAAGRSGKAIVARNTVLQDGQD